MNSVLCKCLFLSILVVLSSSFNVDRNEQLEDPDVSQIEAISEETPKLEEESNTKEGLDTGKQADQPKDTSVDQSTNGESNNDGNHIEGSSNVNDGMQVNPGASYDATETKPEIPNESNDKDNTEEETPAIAEDKPAKEDLTTTELPTENDGASTDNGPTEDDVSLSTDGPTDEETTSVATNEQTPETNTDDCEDPLEEDPDDSLNTQIPEIPEIPQERCDQAKCEATCINYGYTAGGKGHCDSQGRCLCRSYVESCFFGNIDRCKNENWWCPGPWNENKCVHEPEYSKYHMSCFCKGLQAKTRQD